MLSNAYFLAKVRFDTAENEPAKKIAKFSKNAFFENAFLENGSLPTRPSGCGFGMTWCSSRDLLELLRITWKFITPRVTNEATRKMYTRRLILNSLQNKRRLAAQTPSQLDATSSSIPRQRYRALR